MKLPEDIIIEILTRLPTDSVLESKLVCKNWRNAAGHPSFSQKHLKRLISSDDSGNLGFLLIDEEQATRGLYYFEYNEDNETPITSPRKINLLPPELKFYAVVGSSNGLICVIQVRSFIICNPITREFVVLPEMKPCSLYSFGYLASANEYKVVRICESREIEVYTIGSGNGWRNVGNFNSEYGSLRIGVHANGALHRMIMEKRMSIAFDLADEQLREISLPEIPQGVNFEPVGSLGDSLMCVNSMRVKCDRSLDIWLFKENGARDMKMKWEVVHKKMKGLTQGRSYMYVGWVLGTTQNPQNSLLLVSKFLICTWQLCAKEKNSV